MGADRTWVKKLTGILKIAQGGEVEESKWASATSLCWNFFFLLLKWVWVDPSCVGTFFLFGF